MKNNRYKKSLERKKKQFGIPLGTASGRLKKQILFKLVQEANKDICYHCKKRITKIEDFSIEHKINWMYSKNPKKLFFDLENIAFSHLSCNVSSQRKEYKLKSTWKHGDHTGYKNGCRCQECTKAHRNYMRKYLKKWSTSPIW
ncbi:MAG TPA: hypothetical protein P5136_00660 [Methanofastidiosum sp.]|nr:hypothetical protein [Methanofastidiosum sp.]